MRADVALRQLERRRSRQIGLGLVVGVALAAVGATDGLRSLILTVLSNPADEALNPVALFAAYLLQTVILMWITFRAWQHDHHLVSSAAWILATWEAVASITRQDLLFIKRSYPILYDVTAFLHVMGAASLFLAMGYRAARSRDREERERRLGASERPRGG